MGYNKCNLGELYLVTKITRESCMFKLNKSNKLIFCITAIFFSVFLSQFLCMGVNALASQIETSNQVVTPLTLTGTGTLLEPYKISNGADLTNLSAYTNSGGSTKGMYFTISALDLTFDGALEMATVEPIGTTLNPFMGTFDGNNVTLTGATLATSSSGYTGIFGVVKNATIKNLSVQYNKTTTNATYLGGVVASAYHTNIINCHNKTEIENDATTSAVAGVIGYSYNNYIEGCSNASNVSCTSAGSVVAGISAHNVVGEITECSNAGDITGDYMAGGVGGAMVMPLATYPSKNNQHNTGDVTNDPNAGGSSGTSTSSSWGTIQKCCNYGTIKGGSTTSGGNNPTERYAGGIMAIGGYPIKNCYNRGSVSCEAPTNMSNYESSTETLMSRKKGNDFKGGLGKAERFYSAKEIPAYAGGIVGRADNPVTYCYSTGSVKGGGWRVFFHDTFRWIWDQNGSSMGAIPKDKSYVIWNQYDRATGNTFSTSEWYGLSWLQNFSIITSEVSYEANIMPGIDNADKAFYYSSINGKCWVNSTYCFSNTYNDKNDLKMHISIRTEKYNWKTINKGTYTISKLYIASDDLVRRVNSDYMSYTYDDYWTLFRSDLSPKGFRVVIKSTFENKNTSTNSKLFSADISYVAGKKDEKYCDGVQFWAGKLYNFTYQSNLKSIPSVFNKSIWTIDSTGVINGGYPYIKRQYWQDVASKG